MSTISSQKHRYSLRQRVMQSIKLTLVNLALMFNNLSELIPCILDSERFYEYDGYRKAEISFWIRRCAPTVTQYGMMHCLAGTQVSETVDSEKFSSVGSTVDFSCCCLFVIRSEYKVTDNRQLGNRL